MALNMSNLMKKIKWTKIGKLEWSDNLGEMTWDEGVKICETLNGRLPTRIELIDLVDNHKEEIKDWDYTNAFWSSTQHANTPSIAWYVYLSYGDTSYSTKTNRYYVRAIRKS